MVSIFIATDHCTTECIGIHAALRGTRFEALEPLRQGILEHFGAYAQEIAAGPSVRHDHGSQFMSDQYQAELRFLASPRAPRSCASPRATGARSTSSACSRSRSCGRSSSRPSRI